LHMGNLYSADEEQPTEEQAATEEPNTTKSAQKPSSKSQDGRRRLLDEYAVGDILGEGAFGIVSSCKHRTTGKEYAVKMVDKVESTLADIERETEMMRCVDHPNIVKLRGVFYERCFICIVMDKYTGGDVVEGLHTHLRLKGKIPCRKVVHIMQQMGASIQYLHSENIVHRDIKGDNFLMDRPDLTDPNCNIVLTDFGTVCFLNEGDRLSESVGTKCFWSPEFFEFNYGKKIDVWAMGIVSYGLITGCFPFKDEKEIKAKMVRIPKQVHPVCEDVIRGMLEKTERSRLSSDAVMSHEWFSNNKQRPSEGDGSGAVSQSEEESKVSPDEVNTDIRERRQELISRLNREHGNNDGSNKENEGSWRTDKEFTHLHQGQTLTYQWWGAEKVKESGIEDIGGKAEQPENCNDLGLFAQMLQEHNIDCSKFGKGSARPLSQLADEVLDGKARFMLDAAEHKKLVRVVDIVVCRIRPAGEPSLLLIETEEQYPDGRKRDTFRMPAMKVEPYENTRQTLGRIVTVLLHMDRDSIKFDLDTVEHYEEEIESPSYPGLWTVYRKEIVDGVVCSKDRTQLAKVGLPNCDSCSFPDPQGGMRSCSWMTDDQSKVKLNDGKNAAVSTLVRASIGMNEEQLTAYLVAHNVNVDEYNKGSTKTVKEFSSELIRGDASLMEGAGGQLLRVVDVIILLIKNRRTGEIMVQTDYDSASREAYRLPGAKRRPDENHFITARRILRRKMGINPNDLYLDPNVQFAEEEKTQTAYPGLLTVYRKRLIRAEVC